MRVTAAYTYEAQTEEEISLIEGESVDVMENDDPQWWIVKTSQGCGYVPSSYLEMVWRRIYRRHDWMINFQVEGYVKILNDPFFFLIHGYR